MVSVIWGSGTDLEWAAVWRSHCVLVKLQHQFHSAWKRVVSLHDSVSPQTHRHLNSTWHCYKEADTSHRKATSTSLTAAAEEIEMCWVWSDWRSSHQSHLFSRWMKISSEWFHQFLLMPHLFPAAAEKLQLWCCFLSGASSHVNSHVDMLWFVICRGIPLQWTVKLYWNKSYVTFLFVLSTHFVTLTLNFIFLTLLSFTSLCFMSILRHLYSGGLVSKEALDHQSTLAGAGRSLTVCLRWVWVPEGQFVCVRAMLTV